jgi:SynChlorMet cassette protein ScmA
MSPKYEKPKLIPFSSERYETAEGASCGTGASAAPNCVSGGDANVNCNPGSSARTCAFGSTG